MSSVPITPVGSQILVKLDPERESIIAAPDNHEGKPESGVIVAVGPHCTDYDFYVNRRVAFHWTAGARFDILGAGHKFFDPSEIRGFIDKEDGVVTS